MLANAASWERTIVLLPALIVGFGLAAGVFVLLGRGLAQTVRESAHPRLVVGGLIALLGAIAVLTYLGVELPREGG